MFKRLVSAFRLFITTVSDNTAAVQTLAAEQKATRHKLDELVEHSRYQKRVTQAQLQRAGHRID